jgi:hypothetical protein
MLHKATERMVAARVDLGPAGTPASATPASVDPR